MGVLTASLSGAGSPLNRGINGARLCHETHSIGDVKQTGGKERSEIKKKEDEAKLIDWDNKGLYILLPKKEDCSKKREQGQLLNDVTYGTSGTSVLNQRSF